MEIDVKRLRRISLDAKQKQEKERIEEEFLRNEKRKLRDAETAQKILLNLWIILYEAAREGTNEAFVCSMEVAGKRNSNGWLLTFPECDAGDEPEKYLDGPLKTIYEAYKCVDGLVVSLRHDHRGDDDGHCFLSVVVSW